MSGALKSTNIGQLAICPQWNDLTPNWYIEVSGGTNSPPTATLAMGPAATPADPLAHNVNLPDDVAADGFLDGLYAYFATGSNAGQWRKVNVYARTGAGAAQIDFAVGEPGGTLDLPFAPASGDVIYIYAPLPADAISDAGEVEKLPREYETLTYDRPPHLVGLKTNTVSFGVELPGLETPRNSAQGSTAGQRDRWSHLLEGIGSLVQGAGTLTHPTEPSTTSRIYVVSNAGFTSDRVPGAGTSNHLLHNGQLRRVTATGLGGGSGLVPYVEVTPNLAAAPAAGLEVTACETYIPAESGHRKFTVLRRRDDQLREYKGCVITASGTMSYGAMVKLTIEGMGDDFEIYDTLPWNGVQSSQSPLVPNVGSGFFLEPLGPVPTDAALPLTEFTFDLGVERTLHKLATGHQNRVTGRATTMTAKVANADRSLKLGGTFSDLGGQRGYMLGQAGTAEGNAVGFSAYAQIESCSESEQDGLSYWDLGLRHVDGDFQSTPYKPLLMRF